MIFFLIVYWQRLWYNRNMMNRTKKMCITAMMIATGILLPMAFHAIPNAGAIFAPMHLPIMCAGFLCGPIYGALTGIVCPILSFLFTGMPTVARLPNMIMELLIYGGGTGLFFRLIRTKNFLFDSYVSLILSMLLGRAVGGIVTYFLFLGGLRDGYSWSIFFTTYFVTCLPAIVIQLLAVPSVLMIAKKMNFLTERDRLLTQKQPTGDGATKIVVVDKR